MSKVKVLELVIGYVSCGSYLRLWTSFWLFMLILEVSDAYKENGCSVGCPPGTYESSPCSNSRDRMCSDCTECTGSSYEVRPCSPTSDRLCLHVAHPLLIAGDATTPSFIKEMKVEASENIFLEDLHSMRNLETTYYVTDRTQASDFYWDRESGLRVNIGILNVHLIPRYEDVDHDSDNKYMLSNPNNVEDKLKFRKVFNNHCRHPIPDFYSITLEISRDRTTAAEEVSCNSRDSSKPSCPPARSNGDPYLHRTLNDACQKMGTFPEPLQPAGNSIVCTDNSELLREIFNQTYTVERPIRFPSKKCRTALSRCEQCLSHPRCLAQDVFERKCCQIDCYTLLDCKQTVSKECTFVPVECAMGDAFRYTLQPVFQNIRNEFQCHLKHQKHDVLYELFYYIQIPGTDFQTPKVSKTVYARDLSYQSQGEYQADYITVEHNTGLDLKDEFILIGRDNKSNVNFTIHTMKIEEEYRRKKPVVHKISHNIFVTSTQFERPFDYSTSSWVRDNDCRKNVSKMKIVQKHYGTEYQVVNVATQSIGEQFEYFLKSKENPPYLRFMVPGNTSVLPYYFLNNGPYLLTKDSLKTRLDLTTQGRIWEIQISGKMSNCPAYLGITINNRLEFEELFRYDLLILCPVEFNVTFKVPNWGQRPDKTFDIRLQDAIKSYDIYLTQLILESATIETESGAMNVAVTTGLPMTLVAVLSGALLVLVILFSVAYIYKEITKAKLLYGDLQTNYRVSKAGSPSNEAIMERQCMRQHRTIIGLYFVFWIIYSLTFTFTVIFMLLSIAVHSDILRLSKIDELQADMRNLTLATTIKIEQYSSSELSQQADAVTSMQQACSYYIGELFDGVASRVEELMSTEHLQHIYGINASISHLFRQRTKHHLDQYTRSVEKFSQAYRSRVAAGISQSVSRYYRYLHTVLNSDWFSFPQVLFNASEIDARRSPVFSEHHSDLVGFEADFGSFLEIEEVEDMQLWPIQFWQRYSNRIPDQLDFPSELKAPALLQCSTGSSKHSTSAVKMVRLDSSHYVAAQMTFEKSTVALTKFTSINVAEEHRFFPSAPHEWDKLFSDEIGFLGNVSIDVLRIVFLILDVLLLLYRFSNIYLNGIILSGCFSSDANSEYSPEHKVNGGRQIQSSARTVPDRLSDDRTRHMLHEDHVLCEDYADDNCSTELHNRLPLNISSPGHADTGLSAKETTSQEQLAEMRHTNTTRILITMVFRSSTLPKIMFLVVLAILLYVIVRSVLLLLSTEVLLSVDVLGVYLGAINVQVNQTNWYLSDEAKQFNELTLNFYEGQMNLELLNLQTLLEYFNAEQKRLIDNYVTEACLVKKLPQVNWTCDVSVVLQRLEIPMLPCNFMPIQPQLYTGFKLADYESEAGSTVQPFLHAAKNVVTRTSLAVVIVVCSMLIVNIAASLLYHHFYATLHRHHHHHHHHPPSAAKLCICSDRHAPAGEASQSIVTCQPEFVDYDSEEYLETGYRGCVLSPRDVQENYTNAATLQVDFKYSETKV